MSIYKVKNLQEGCRDVPTGFTSWIDYWEEATKLRAGLCHRLFCKKSPSQATDGAHVQLDDSNNNKWYIVPLCHKCKCDFGEHFSVSGPLVSVTDPTDILW